MGILGDRLRSSREAKGWKQVYVAKILEITSQALSNYERGDRDPDTPLLRQLAELYGVSTDYLVGLTDDPAPKDTQHVNDDDALEYLDDLHKRPEMKTLFQVGRKATKEDIETAIGIIELLKKKSQPEE